MAFLRPEAPACRVYSGTPFSFLFCHLRSIMTPPGWPPVGYTAPAGPGSHVDGVAALCVPARTPPRPGSGAYFGSSGRAGSHSHRRQRSGTAMKMAFELPASFFGASGVHAVGGS